MLATAQTQTAACQYRPSRSPLGRRGATAQAAPGGGAPEGRFIAEGYAVGSDSDFTAFQVELITPNEASQGATDTISRTIIGITDGNADSLEGGTGQGPAQGFIGLHTHHDVFQELTSELPPFSIYRPMLRDGADPGIIAGRMETEFIGNSMIAVDSQAEIDRAQAANQQFNLLFQGFLGLGLVVGAASVGMLAMRAVNERRKHIAIMRALGYRAMMIRAGFIIESVLAMRAVSDRSKHFAITRALGRRAMMIRVGASIRDPSGSPTLRVALAGTPTRTPRPQNRPNGDPLGRRGALGRPVLPRSTRLPTASVLRAVPRRILERVAELAHRSAHLAHSTRLGTGRRINDPSASLALLHALRRLFNLFLFRLVLSRFRRLEIFFRFCLRCHNDPPRIEPPETGNDLLRQIYPRIPKCVTKPIPTIYHDSCLRAGAVARILTVWTGTCLPAQTAMTLG